jgi:hypothetical protein
METFELLAYEGVRRTLARYTLAGDRGRVDELATCFSPQGVLEVDGGWTARGRDEIRRRTGATADTATRQRTSPLMRHHLTTQRIELDSDGSARAWTYFLVVSEIGPDHAGRYVDRLARSGDEWLIVHRRVVVEWQSRDSVHAVV